MFSTQLLCERVRVPSQSPARVSWLTSDTARNVKGIIDHLSREGLKKSVSRVIGDTITVALDECSLRGLLIEAPLRQVIQEVDLLSKTKISVLLPETEWQRLDALAERLSDDTKVTPSQVLRSLAHVATQQVYDDLSNR